MQQRHQTFMRKAIQLAQEAASNGEVPVGCVIVKDDVVVGMGRNAVQEYADPTLHAELVAIRDAVQTLGEKFLEGACLYVTLEPCVMCAGAILMARIQTVVYGASEPKTGAARSVFELLDDPKQNHTCVVRSGILERECSELLTNFFEQQRSATTNTVTLPTTPVSLSPLQQTTERGRVEKGGVLYLVPTPIGNLSDITKRALETLQKADAVYCEDTRHTGTLLKHYGITVKQLLSNHEHNEVQRAHEIASRVQEGGVLALVSDAGMPGISDPGYRAVRACAERGLTVTALPGASAAVTALAASGLPTNRWFFGGFPPQKKGRSTFVASVTNRSETVVLYESPHRLDRLLAELQEHTGPDRLVVVARELSKVHEEYVRGSIAEVIATLAAKSARGECVVILQGTE